MPIPDPIVERERRPLLLQGDLPSPANPPTACRFHTRCPYVQPTRCRDERPELRDFGGGHTVACHFVEPILSGELKPHAQAPEWDPGIVAPAPEPPPT